MTRTFTFDSAQRFFGLTVHPLADSFPLGDEDYLQATGKDIRENGLNHLIILDQDGQLIDGRNRLEALRLTGILPQQGIHYTVQWFNTDEERVARIRSENLNRRQLSDSQHRFLLAVAIRAGEIVAQVDEDGKRLRARGVAAQIGRCSEGTMQSFLAVVDHGCEALKTLVMSGEVKPDSAAPFARFVPLARQEQLIDPEQAKHYFDAKSIVNHRGRVAHELRDLEVGDLVQCNEWDADGQEAVQRGLAIVTDITDGSLVTGRPVPSKADDKPLSLRVTAYRDQLATWGWCKRSTEGALVGTTVQIVGDRYGVPSAVPGQVVAHWGIQHFELEWSVADLRNSIVPVEWVEDVPEAVAEEEQEEASSSDPIDNMPPDPYEERQERTDLSTDTTLHALESEQPTPSPSEEDGIEPQDWSNNGPKTLEDRAFAWQVVGALEAVQALLNSTSQALQGDIAGSDYQTRMLGGVGELAEELHSMVSNAIETQRSWLLEEVPEGYEGADVVLDPLQRSLMCASGRLNFARHAAAEALEGLKEARTTGAKLTAEARLDDEEEQQLDIERVAEQVKEVPFKEGDQVTFVRNYDPGLPDEGAKGVVFQVGAAGERVKVQLSKPFAADDVQLVALWVQLRYLERAEGPRVRFIREYKLGGVSEGATGAVLKRGKCGRRSQVALDNPTAEAANVWVADTFLEQLEAAEGVSLG